MKELQQTKSSSVDQAKPDSEPPKCCNFNPPMLPVSGTDPAFVSFNMDGKATPTKDRLIPLARQSSIEDDERPPAFTPGSYSDPIIEKVHASAAMRDQYGVGHEEGGFEAI